VSGPKPKTAIFRYPARSLQENFYCKPMEPMESVHWEGVPFGGSQLIGCEDPKWGNRKPTQKFRVPEIHFVHPVRCRKIQRIQW